MSLYQDYSLEKLIEKVGQTPDEIDLHIELIKRYVIEENLEGAIHQANLTNELMPNDLTVLSLKAFCLVNLGHPEEGCEILDTLVRQNATCEFQEMIQNEIAPMFQQDIGDMTREEYLQMKIEQAPEDQKKFFERSVAFLPIQDALLAGELEDATEMLLVHLLEFPEDLNAEMGLAGVYEMQGQFEQSEQLYRKVIEVDPGSSSAFFGLAGVVSDLKEQIELTRRGLELSPSCHTERYNLGVRLLHAGEVELAKREFSRIPADEQIYPYAMSAISECFELAEDLIQAIDYQEIAVTLAANDPIMHARLGALKNDAGFHSEGLESLEHAIELDPTSTTILMLQAEALENLGQATAAIELLENALVDAPNDFQLNQGLGVFYYRQEDFQTSIKHSLQAIEANCDAYSSYWNVAVSYARLEQRDECLQYLRAAVDRDPELASRILSDDDLQAYRADKEFLELASTAPAIENDCSPEG